MVLKKRENGVMAPNRSDYRQRVKGEVFAKAYARAQRALAAGFYIEAIAICDSLITDRLRLILTSNSEAPASHASTGKIANFLISQDVPCFDEKLWTDVLDWSRARNRHAHEMGNISGDDLVPWRTRISHANQVAKAGFALVNRVSKEARLHRI